MVELPEQRKRSALTLLQLVAQRLFGNPALWLPRFLEVTSDMYARGERDTMRCYLHVYVRQKKKDRITYLLVHFFESRPETGLYCGSVGQLRDVITPPPKTRIFT